MSLEQIVRPFQSENPFARFGVLPSLNYSGGTSSDTWTTTIYGDAAAEPKKLTGNFSVSNTVYQDKESTITPQATEVARVENEDDPDQYVDTERYSIIDQESGKGKNYQRVRAKVDNSDTEGADAKIIRKSKKDHWSNFDKYGTDFNPYFDENGEPFLNDDGTSRGWSWEPDGYGGTFRYYR